MPNLTLVVPCFNEARRLDVEAFRRFQMDGLHVLFVNDGSTDDTAGLLDEFCSSEPEGRFTVAHLRSNQGKAEAVRVGMATALEGGCDLVGFWDADLATPLAELPSFIEVFETRPEITAVFAARVRLLGRDISRRPVRHYIGRVGATLISSSLGLAVYDTQCGAKLFRSSETLRKIVSKPFLSRWIFDTEIIARLIQAEGRDAVAHSLYELPVKTWHDVPGSKVRATDFFRALGDLWKIHRAYNSQP